MKRRRKNPGDKYLRRMERTAARSGDPEALAASARARQRYGESVQPWEIYPISYVFLAAYDRLNAKPPGRVEALYGPPELDVVIRFYVSPCSYPLAPAGERGPGDPWNDRERHLRGMKYWIARGAIPVEIPPSDETMEVLADPEVQGEARFFWEIYRRRVLIRNRDVRNARRSAGNWTVGEQSVLLPQAYGWARLMQKRKGRWK